MQVEKRYDLEGFIVARSWMGDRGFVSLIIKTDQEGLDDIRSNPLQDYIAFGVREVEYATFEVFERTIKKTKNRTTITKIHKPIEHIEAGENRLTEEDMEFLRQMEPAVVYY